MYKHTMLFETTEYLEQQFIFRGVITSFVSTPLIYEAEIHQKFLL